MPRKRTPKDTTPDATSQPAVAETNQPDEPTLSAAATSAPPTGPSAESEPSFVERLARERQPGIVPDPFGIAGDYEAGVRLFENRRGRLMVIKFDQKPNDEVLIRMKDAGFRWNPRDQVWVHPIHEDNARRVRVEAERTYQDVRQMIRQERGLGESTEIPF